MKKEKQHKIVMPTQEEVAEYAPDSNSASAPPGAESPSAEPVEVVPKAEEGEETVESLRGKITELEDKLLRAQAECANVTKRLSSHHAESLKLAGMALARDLLAVVDSFERTLASLGASDPDDPIVQGVKLVSDLLLKTLKDHGVEPIAAVGSPFDPTLHEAVMQDPDTDQPSDTVTQELQRGYTMNDRVIRPAKVAVAGGQDEAGDPESSVREQDQASERGGEPSGDATRRLESDHADL